MDAQPPLHDGSSAAQCCPEDVLWEILTYLFNGDVARCSLVCHSWLGACRGRLYTVVHFGTSTSTSDSLLSRTLYTSPHLLGLIRRFVLFPMLPHDEDTYKWMPSLASSSRVRSLVVSQAYTVVPLLSILSSTPPFVSIKQVSLCCNTMQCNRMSIQRVLEMFPNADSFALDLHPSIDDFSPPAHGPHVIRHISVRSFTGPVNAVVRFLETYASSLTRLDIVGTVPPKEEILVRTLLSMTHLTSLAINVPGCPSPFLDHVVPQLPHLRDLRCRRPSYSSTLLQELPDYIHTLGLDGCINSDVAAIEEMIWRSRAHKTSLRDLRFPTDQLRAENKQRIEAACADSGVRFSRCGLNYEFAIP